VKPKRTKKIPIPLSKPLREKKISNGDTAVTIDAKMAILSFLKIFFVK